MRFLPHFDAKLEYLVHQLDIKVPTRRAEAGVSNDVRRSVDPRQIGDQRIQNDHAGRRRAKP